MSERMLKSAPDSDSKSDVIAWALGNLGIDADDLDLAVFETHLISFGYAIKPVSNMDRIRAMQA